MHPRFEGARTARAEMGDSSFEVVMAESFRLRLLGLMRIDEADVPPLLFPRCRSLHTYWMKMPIDVVWLDLSLDAGAGSATVLEVVTGLVPGTRAKAPSGLEREVRRRVAALELPPALAPALAPGVVIDLSFGAASA